MSRFVPHRGEMDVISLDAGFQQLIRIERDQRLERGEILRREKTRGNPRTEWLRCRDVWRNLTAEHPLGEIPHLGCLGCVPQSVGGHADASRLALGIAELPGDTAQIAGNVNLGCVRGYHSRHDPGVFLEPTRIDVEIAVEERGDKATERRIGRLAAIDPIACLS